MKDLQALVGDDDLLLRLVVDSLRYHEILAKQTGVDQFAIAVRDLRPEAVMDLVAKKVQHEGEDRD